MSDLQLNAVSPPTETISDEVRIWPLACKPGVRRDGTRFETNEYRAAQHCRWYKGRARKMGGYRNITTAGSDNLYAVHVFPMDGVGWTHVGSIAGVQQLQISDITGLGTAPIDRTPSAYVANADNLWQFQAFYDDSVGVTDGVILAFVAPNLTSIDSDTGGTIYKGIINGSALLTSITDAVVWPPGNPSSQPNAPTVAGGICVGQPFVVAYGAHGFVAWTDENSPGSWGTGSAGQDRVAPDKIVYASVVRGSTAPTFVLWSLSCVIRMTYSLGPNIFSFNTVTDKTSIVSSRCVAEANGVFYWPAQDCFMMYDGVVRELPNDYNQDFFYDNLNLEQRQKVWTYVDKRFGEIWWFFPFGSATECTNAVIFNYRYGYWYDTELNRVGGWRGSTFSRPVLGDDDAGLWVHEYGYDKITGSGVEPILSYYETSDLAFPSTGPAKSGWMGMDRWGKFLRLEPDWVGGSNAATAQSGAIELTITRRKYAMSATADEKVSTYTLAQGTTKKDFKDTGRLTRLKFSSNVQGGFYQAGEHLLHIGMDDGNQ